MKTFKQILALGIILILSCKSETNAQIMWASNPAPPFLMGATNGRATGNDILDYLGNTFEVSVWEDTWGNAGLGYNVYGIGGSYSGTIQPSQIRAALPIRMFVCCKD